MKFDLFGVHKHLEDEVEVEADARRDTARFPGYIEMQATKYYIGEE